MTDIALPSKAINRRPLEDIMQSLHKETRTFDTRLDESSFYKRMLKKTTSFFQSSDATIDIEIGHHHVVSNETNISYRNADNGRSKRIVQKIDSFQRRNKIKPDNMSSLSNISVINHHWEHSFSRNTLGQSSQSSVVAAKKLTVMIVDDSAMNRKIVRRTIEGYVSSNVLNGCEVAIEEADDGITAIETYRTISDKDESVDLVVLGILNIVFVFFAVFVICCFFIIFLTIFVCYLFLNHIFIAYEYIDRLYDEEQAWTRNSL